jgi:uncharacterized membrane protein
MTAPNPYQAPVADGDVALPEAGDFTVGGAISEAFELTKQNFPLWLGVGIVGTLLVGLSAVTIIGYFVLVPVFAWGLAKFMLNMVDRRAAFGDLFAGFSNYGSTLMRTLGMTLCFIGLVLVGDSVAIIGQVTKSVPIQLVGNLIYLVFTFAIMIRFYFALFFLCDNPEMGAIDSLKASWAATRGKTGKLIGLAFVSSLVGMLGLLALVIGVIFTLMVAYLSYATAYRQMVGPSRAR